MATPDARATQRSSARADRVIARPCLRLSRAAPLLELVGHLVDADLDAGFVLVAAGSAGDTDRADDLLTDHDRQRAARGSEAGEILRAHLRILLQPLFHLARGNAESARGKGFLEAVLHGVRRGAVTADLHQHFAVASDDGSRHAVAVRAAGGHGGLRDVDCYRRGKILARE